MFSEVSGVRNLILPDYTISVKIKLSYCSTLLQHLTVLFLNCLSLFCPLFHETFTWLANCRFVSSDHS